MTIDSYGLMLPEGWTAVPLDEAGLRTHLEEVVAPLREEDGWTKAMERRVELLMRTLVHELRSQRVSFAAGVTHLIVEPGTDEVDGRLMTASCTISTTTAGDLGSPIDITPDVLIRLFSAQRDREDGTRITDLEPPCVHPLSVGDSVRLRRLVEGAGAAVGDDDAVFIETYLVPHASDGRLIVCQYSTPVVEESPLFSRLFEAMQSTFRVFEEGEPTVFEPVEAGSG
ncbi:MAG: hypothetical protein R8F63_00555 [Acidimicrobiales bacterium]|nr:hypothetical protein [Acidimicrobiales bacterium]